VDSGENIGSISGRAGNGFLKTIGLPCQTLYNVSKCKVMEYECWLQLILRKIIETVAARCQILWLKCTKFDFDWGSAPDPHSRNLQRSPKPLAGFKGTTVVPLNPARGLGERFRVPTTSNGEGRKRIERVVRG